MVHFPKIVMCMERFFKMLYLISDINECSINNGNCSQMCNNTIGSYVCSCSIGYLLSSNNRSCSGMCFIIFKKLYYGSTYIISEINECSINNGNCSQLCTNTNGSYFCSCNPGYVLNGNNMTCNGEMALNSNCCQLTCCLC